MFGTGWSSLPVVDRVVSPMARRRRSGFRPAFCFAALWIAVFGGPVGTTVAQAQQPGENVKWIQQPDLSPAGIDIRVDSGDDRLRVLADDFRCTEPSFLTDVHFWGSWLEDKKGEIEKIRLSIFTDDPVGPGGSDPANNFSKPDKLLWEMDFGRGEFTEELAAVVEEGEYFWDAPQGELIFPGDKEVWEYTIKIPQALAFEQIGTEKEPVVYWLAIAVNLVEPDSQFGWKTRTWPEHFNDDAVIGPDPWIELRYPRGHPYADQQPNSIDMAFALTFEQQAVEIDQFDFTIGSLEIVMPDGTSEILPVTGPTTVAVYFEGAMEGDAHDDNGNGRDEVVTEMLDLNLTGVSPTLGPIHVGLNPAIPTLGQIEERVDMVTGRLDLPPFGDPGTLADSFFDIFVEIEVGGQKYYTQQPKRMATVITHKPPAPGDYYENCERIELYDALGNATGIFLDCTRHRPRPPLEIDVFDFTIGALEIVMPDSSSETVAVSGPTTVRVYFEGAVEGAAVDDNGNGREEVVTEMVDLDLTGTSPTLGLIRVGLNPAVPSFGQIEERVNSTPGTLDLPPFAAAGTAESFFDIFVEIEVGGQRLHTVLPKRMATVITNKPPAPGNVYENCVKLELYDESGQPTGYYLGCARHEPRPPIEIDVFEYSLGDIALQFPDGRTEPVTLAGPTTVHVMIPPDGRAADTDGDGLDQVPTEMVALSLTGSSSLGPVLVRLDPSHPTLGEIEERVNNTPGTLDVPPFTSTGNANSFFDVFFEIEVGGMVLHPESPLLMVAVITHKPPAPGDVYGHLLQQPIQLFDEQGNPTGVWLVGASHEPDPPVEIDVFDLSLGGIVLQLPGGPEAVSLAGPTIVRVMIPPDGRAADTDGDGRDQVPTEMVQLDLCGSSSLGPVRVRLDPSHRTLGEIEELVNYTPGILNVPPFTPVGSAQSFFNVFFEIDVGGLALHPETPLLIVAVITHKPPAPGEVYVYPGQQPIRLLDQNGDPTDVFVVSAWHVPNPVGLTIRKYGIGQAEVAWPLPAAGYILQATLSLYSPVPWFDILPPYLVVGSEYVYRTTGGDSQLFFRLKRVLP